MPASSKKAVLGRDDFRIFSATVDKLSKCDNNDEISQVLVDTFSEMTVSSWITVTLAEYHKGPISVRAWSGASSMANKVARLMGLDPRKVKVYGSDFPKKFRHLFTGFRLKKIEDGLYQTLLGKVPKRLCTMASKMLGIEKTYISCLSFKKETCGSIVFHLKKEGILPSKKLIETIIHYAAVLIRRNYALDELAARDKWVRQTFNTAALGLINFRPDGRLLLVNGSFEKISGFSQSECLRRNLHNIVKKEDRQLLTETIKRQIDGSSEAVPVELRILNRKGSEIWVKLTVSRAQDEPDDSDNLTGVVENIQKGKQVEKELEVSSAHIDLVNEMNKMLNSGEGMDSIMKYSCDTLKDMYDLLSADFLVREKLNPQSQYLVYKYNNIQNSLLGVAEKLVGFEVKDMLVPLFSGSNFEKLYKAGRPLEFKGKKEVINIVKDMMAPEYKIIRNMSSRVVSIARIRNVYLLPISVRGKVIASMGLHSEDPLSEDVKQKLKIVTDELTSIFERIVIEKDLSQASANWQVTFNSIKDQVILVSNEMEIIDANEAACVLNKKKASQLIGSHCSKLLICSQVHKAGCPFKDVIRKGEDYSVEVEDGSKTYWATLTPVKDRFGEVLSVIYIIRDVSEMVHNEKLARKSLAEKELLLKEVHHRVKNNLQIVSSLLGLQASHISEGPFQEYFINSQNRVHTMSIIHKLLYQSGDFTDINIKKYIDNLSTYLLSVYRTTAKGLVPQVSIKSDIHDLMLNINKAIPCGLIINELVSNSIKHAFSGRSSGTINIHFHRDKNKYILEVTDDGSGFNPLEQEDSPESLGMLLVRTLTEQISGKLTVKKKKGAFFRITFK